MSTDMSTDLTANTLSDSRIPCPICRELILPGAKKCRYCGTALEPTSDEHPHLHSSASVGNKAKGTWLVTDHDWKCVPFYRKVWFAVCMFLVCIPVLLVIALSGEIYTKRRSQVYVMSKRARVIAATLAGTLLIFQVARVLSSE